MLLARTLQPESPAPKLTFQHTSMPVPVTQSSVGALMCDRHLMQHAGLVNQTSAQPVTSAGKMTVASEPVSQLTIEKYTTLVAVDVHQFTITCEMSVISRPVI